MAVKLLHAGTVQSHALERFQGELEALARARHPNVVHVHTVGTSPNGLYLVMDLVEGQTLHAAREEPGWTHRRSAEVLRDLAAGVAVLHAQDVLHRDLKPDNVMVRPDGTPVLLDFGLARHVETDELTQTAQTLGALHFMSPEQAQGAQGVLDVRTDVYGLGALLFQLLAGEPPFTRRGSFINVLQALLEIDPVWPSSLTAGVDPALEAICRRAMAKSPEARYPNVAALREDLERNLAGQVTEAETDLAKTRSRRRRRLAAAALGVALLAAGAILASQWIASW